MSKHTMAKKTYTAVVIGDINGDGKITLTDFVKAKAHLLGKELITPQVY